MTVNGTSGSDVMKLGNVAHTVNGGDGVDQIKGGSAIDTLRGDGGNDKINGGGGVIHSMAAPAPTFSSTPASPTATPPRTIPT